MSRVERDRGFESYSLRQRADRSAGGRIDSFGQGSGKLPREGEKKKKVVTKRNWPYFVSGLTGEVAERLKATAC